MFTARPPPPPPSRTCVFDRSFPCMGSRDPTDEGTDCEETEVIKKKNFCISRHAARARFISYQHANDPDENISMER